LETKRNISSITGTVRKNGNGAHVMAPKEWIGQDVHVIPVAIFNEEALNDMLKGVRFGRMGRGQRRRRI
jgi:putative transposon-encoded protein